MSELRLAQFPQNLKVVRALFQAYANSLGIDLSFQGFEAELEELPGKYALPLGRVLLACEGGTPIGCVCLRPISHNACEMKRLYVCPEGRGQHLGHRLVERICHEARSAGYSHIFLDTLASMHEAISIYVSHGFKPTTPYVFNPMADAQYFVLDL